jgi:hypothetical protein
VGPNERDYAGRRPPDHRARRAPLSGHRRALARRCLHVDDPFGNRFELRAGDR